MSAPCHMTMSNTNRHERPSSPPLILPTSRVLNAHRKGIKCSEGHLIKASRNQCNRLVQSLSQRGESRADMLLSNCCLGARGAVQQLCVPGSLGSRAPLSGSLSVAGSPGPVHTSPSTLTPALRAESPGRGSQAWVTGVGSLHPSPSLQGPPLSHLPGLSALSLGHDVMRDPGSAAVSSPPFMSPSRATADRRAGWGGGGGGGGAGAQTADPKGGI